MVNNLIYDVGMHNGDDTAYYLSLGYTVIAIEASPELVAAAQLRFEASLAAKKLTILNIGIASKEGVLDFYLNKKNSVWNSFDKAIGTREGADVEIIKVRTKSLHEILREYGRPFYLKIDIEGNDIICLTSLTNEVEKPAYVSAEVNGIDLILKLHELGYTRFKLIDQFSFLPLELPVMPEYAFFMRHKKFRGSANPSVRVIRKLFGKTVDAYFESRYRPVFSYPHSFGSSGPFGDNLPGKWQHFEEVLKIYLHYKSEHEGSIRDNGYNFWVDIHAGK